MGNRGLSANAWKVATRRARRISVFLNVANCPCVDTRTAPQPVRLRSATLFRSMWSDERVIRECGVDEGCSAGYLAFDSQKHNQKDLNCWMNDRLPSIPVHTRVRRRLGVIASS